MRILGMLLLVVILELATPAWPDPLLPQGTSYEAICGVVEEAARVNRLSAAVLTRLIWYESGFQIGAVSRVGARGVAQFMPATATEQGLLDPFDPRQAIPHAANFLADLDHRFGNIGLAVAAYNAGPNRVTNWLARTEILPRETALFVLAVTGRSAEEWSSSGSFLGPPVSSEPQTCVALTALLPAIQVTALGRRYSHMIPGLERSGLVLPALRQSGHPLPEFQQSGRMLPGLE
jgi:hypothetical protein